MVQLRKALSSAVVLAVGLTAPASADTLGVVNAFGGRGTGDGQFINLVDVTTGPNGDVYTIENGGGVNDRVQRFDASGRFLGKTGSEGSAPGQFQQGWWIAVGGGGVVYGLGTFSHRVTRLPANLSSVLRARGAPGPGAQQ